jgi:hypothetical protein
MTYILFKEFLEDGLTTLKVDRADWPEIKSGVALVGDKADSLYINWDRRCLLIYVPLFELLTYRKDAPSPMRILAYSKANQWKRSLERGELLPENEKDIIVAYSIASIKGLQLFYQGIPSPMFSKIRDRIKQLTGLNTDIVEALRLDGVRQPVLQIRADSNEDRFVQELNELVSSEASDAKPLDYLSDGELGSLSNPFRNVHDAAEYILNLERERLNNDAFRTYLNSHPFFCDFEQRIFRIPWATPYVAYLGGNGTIPNGFVVNQLRSRRFNFKPNLINRKFLFRGQAEFYSPCVPNMFRIKTEHNFAKYNVFSCEMEILLDSHPMVQLFKQGMELFNDKFVFEVNYGGLSQHYYNKTQFLDLTSNIEAAKFFAVTTFDMDNNCYAPYDKDGIGVLYYYDIEPDAFRKCGQEYRLTAIGKQPFMRSGAQHGYLLAMTKGLDFNNLPQVRYVFFKHDKAVTDDIFKKSGNGNLYMRKDILQRYWYEKLTDPDRKNVISHDAFLKNWEHNKQTSKRKLLKSLEENGIKVSKGYIPHFSEEDLREYYYKNAIQDWQEFCKDVYFYSPEGRILKEHLLGLPNVHKYRKFFYE